MPKLEASAWESANAIFTLTAWDKANKLVLLSVNLHKGDAPSTVHVMMSSDEIEGLADFLLGVEEA